MKILLSGYHNPNFITITEYIERAIEGLGHSLISFEDREFVIPGRIRQRVCLLQEWDLKRLNNKLLSLALKHEPDFMLVTGGHRIFAETVEKIKKRGTIAALWTIDQPREFQPLIDVAPLYDFIFCGGTEAQELLAEAGIKKTHWIPFACNPDFHKPEDVTSEDKKKWGSDVTFVGSFYPNRAQIFEKLVDFNLKIWGPAWNKLPDESPLRKLARDQQLSPEEWIKILCSSKIGIVIHYQDDKIPCYQASPKVYETMACRSFLLVDDQKDVKALFEDGKHLAVFKDTDDLREKIKYYLNHPEERKSIAEKGYREVLQKHSFKHRLEKIISIVKGNRVR